MVCLRCLLSDVGRVHARLEAAVNLRLRNDFGLTMVLFEAMTVLEETTNCRTHDLAAGLGMTSGGASKLVDRLCALGYCLRIPNPEDRGSSLLTLTLGGRERMAQAAEVIDGEMERLLGALLSRAQIAELAGTLHTLQALGSRPSSEVVPPTPSRGPPIAH
jgi:DNA-binding MarR family transcriptional regulator